MEKNKPDYYNNLDKIYSKIWELLQHGFRKKDSPFHLPVFICGNNDKLDGRIVVLRGVEESAKKLWFHSDIRSNKIKIIKSHPKSSLLFYDRDKKIQLRIGGNSKINYRNDTTDISWKKTIHMSRQCYLGNKAPGSLSDIPTSGLTENIDNFKYTIEESEIGFNNFCVVEFYIKSIEWLYLAAKGHRRAFFNLHKEQIEKKWLIP